MTTDELARKVAHAAVAWFDCEDDGGAEATTYAALLRATIEYRECCRNVADKKEDATKAPPSVELTAQRD